MKQSSSQTVKLLNEERALLMSLAAKRDASYSDVLRLGLYQLAKLDGLHAQMTQAVWARIEHVLEVEAVADEYAFADRIYGTAALWLRSSPFVPALLALGFATSFIHYVLDRAASRLLTTVH